MRRCRIDRSLLLKKMTRKAARQNGDIIMVSKDNHQEIQRRILTLLWAVYCTAFNSVLGKEDPGNKQGLGE